MTHDSPLTIHHFVLSTPEAQPTDAAVGENIEANMRNLLVWIDLAFKKMFEVGAQFLFRQQFEPLDATLQNSLIAVAQAAFNRAAVRVIALEMAGIDQYFPDLAGPC